MNIDSELLKVSNEVSENIARENIQKAQQKMKTYYDKNSKEPDYIIGQKVWVYTPKTKKGLSKKMLHLWHGPYRLVEQLSPVHFFLRSSNNSRVKFAVHVNRMKHYVDPDERPIDPPEEEVNEPYLDHSDIPDDSFTEDYDNNEQDNKSEESEQLVPDTHDENVGIATAEHNPIKVVHLPDSASREHQTSLIDNTNVFAAEGILRKRTRKGKTQYLIKWANHPHSANTWEPEENILDDRLIQAFTNNTK